MKATKTRQKILKNINHNIGNRLGNIQRGTGTEADQAIISEA